MDGRTQRSTFSQASVLEFGRWGGWLGSLGLASSFSPECSLAVFDKQGTWLQRGPGPDGAADILEQHQFIAAVTCVSFPSFFPPPSLSSPFLLLVWFVVCFSVDPHGEHAILPLAPRHLCSLLSAYGPE